MTIIYPDLAGKIAVVTGGSRGIGAAISQLLAQNGVKVVVNGRGQEAIDATVASIREGGGAAFGFAADCTDFASLERMRAWTEQELGPVEILVANVGGGGNPMPVAQIEEADWRSVLDANLTSTFLTIKSYLPGMIERQQGSILTMASSAGRLAGQASPSYAAAKAGVVMLTRHVANESGKYGIRANCLAPSAILTEGVLRRMSEEQRQKTAALFPLGRLGEPEDVAQAALFLLSHSASWLTGVTLDVAGGRILV